MSLVYGFLKLLQCIMFFFLFYRKFSFKMSFNDCAIYVWSKDTRSGLFLSDPFPFIPTCPGIHIILILGAC